MMRLALLLLSGLFACQAPPVDEAPTGWDALDATLASEADDPVGAAMAWRALRDDATAEPAARSFARLRLAGLGEFGPLDGAGAPFPGDEPLAFLEALTTTDRAFVVVPDAVAWPRPSSFPWLTRLVDLDVPCASVHSLRDSSLDVLSQDPLVLGHDDDASTLGHEAAYLLAGARHGLYPMSHESSVDWPLDRDALVAWARAAR